MAQPITRRETIHDDAQIKPAFVGRHKGDIRAPFWLAALAEKSCASRLGAIGRRCRDWVVVR
jgi:hypothetical protein